MPHTRDTHQSNAPPRPLERAIVEYPLIHFEPCCCGAPEHIPRRLFSLLIYTYRFPRTGHGLNFLTTAGAAGYTPVFPPHHQPPSPNYPPTYLPSYHLAPLRPCPAFGLVPDLGAVHLVSLITPETGHHCCHTKSQPTNPYICHTFSFNVDACPTCVDRCTTGVGLDICCH